MKTKHVRVVLDCVLEFAEPIDRVPKPLGLNGGASQAAIDALRDTTGALLLLTNTNVTLVSERFARRREAFWNGDRKAQAFFKEARGGSATKTFESVERGERK